MEASEDYDLLPVDKKNDIFRVTFDLYTARPHFLLLPQPGIEDMSEDHSFSPEQRQQLIVTAREMLASSNISSGTLSIHRGSWISKEYVTAHFHLCVDVTNYLRIFEAKKKTDFTSWFKSEDCVDSWMRKIAYGYVKNVKKYPTTTYHEKAVGYISDIIGKDGARNSLTKKQSTSENTENLVYHRKHPKIGFPGNGTAEDLKNILIKMEEYAVLNELTIRDSVHDNYGCHLCLNLGSDSGTY